MLHIEEASSYTTQIHTQISPKFENSFLSTPAYNMHSLPCKRLQYING